SSDQSPTGGGCRRPLARRPLSPQPRGRRAAWSNTALLGTQSGPGCAPPTVGVPIVPPPGVPPCDCVGRVEPPFPCRLDTAQFNGPLPCHFAAGTSLPARAWSY